MATTANRNYARLIATDLRKRYHLNNAGVGAFLGNLKWESSFNPNAYNAGENAHGWAQWEGGRWVTLQAIGRRLGVSPTSPKAELAMLNHELDTGYSGVIASLHTTSNVDVAAQIVQSRFEGSDPSTLPQRTALARAFAGQLDAGTLHTGGKLPKGIFTAVGVPSANGPLGGAPYPWDSGSKVPSSLTPTQRSRIIAWLVKVSGKPAFIGGTNPVYTPADLAGKSDKALAAIYYYVYRGYTGAGGLSKNPQGKIPILQDAIHGVTGEIKSVLTWLGHELENIALVIFGIILIVLGIVVLSHQK